MNNGTYRPVYCIVEMTSCLTAGPFYLGPLLDCGDSNDDDDDDDDNDDDAVETVTAEYCKANDQLNVTSLTSGYIASVMTSDTPYCDGSSHPWMIAGLPGQTINLTLYDFAVENPLRTGQRHPATPASVDQPAATAATAASEASGDDVCVQYGLVEDSGLAAVDGDGVKPVAICSDGRRRIQHVYQSVGNLVKIWITAGVAPTDLKRFVIHYTGTDTLMIIMLIVEVIFVITVFFSFFYVFLPYW